MNCYILIIIIIIIKCLLSIPLICLELENISGCYKDTTELASEFRTILFFFNINFLTSWGRSLRGGLCMWGNHQPNEATVGIFRPPVVQYTCKYNFCYSDSVLLRHQCYEKSNIDANAETTSKTALRLSPLAQSEGHSCIYVGSWQFDCFYVVKTYVLYNLVLSHCKVH